MSDPDPLAEIKQHRRLMYGPNTDPHHFVNIRLSDLDWLVAEVERLRSQLARLEWVGFDVDWMGCPVCFHRSSHPHNPDCWLAAELKGKP
jgi:hypothetical protein